MVGWSHAATENPQGSLQIFTQGQHFSGTGFRTGRNRQPGSDSRNHRCQSEPGRGDRSQDRPAELRRGIWQGRRQRCDRADQVGLATSFTAAASGSAARMRSRRAIPSRSSNPIRSLAASFRRLAGSSSAAPSAAPIIKDKLFFFGDYQGTRQTNGVSGTFTVPTSSGGFRACNPATNAASATPGFCDLSEYLTAGVTGGGQVYDP